MEKQEAIHSIDEPIEGLPLTEESLLQKEEGLSLKEDGHPLKEEGLPLKEEGLPLKEALPLKEDGLSLKEEISQKQEDKDEQKDDKCDDDNQNKEKEVSQKMEEENVVHETQETNCLFLIEAAPELSLKKIAVLGEGEKYDTVLNLLRTHNKVKMIGDDNMIKLEGKETKKEEDKESADNDEYIIQIIPMKASDMVKNKDSSAT